MTEKKYTPFDILCSMVVMVCVMTLLLAVVFEKRIDYIALAGIVFGSFMPSVIRYISPQDTFTVHSIECLKCNKTFNSKNRFVVELKFFLHRIKERFKQ